jgi:hypothetical protein
MELKCPHCGSDNISLSVGITGDGESKGDARIECKACGRQSALSGSRSEEAKNGCFVATAVYGSRHAKEVRVLYDFRDRVLSTNRLGRFLVSRYYLVSQKVVPWVSSPGPLRTLARFLIGAVVGALNLAGFKARRE